MPRLTLLVETIRRVMPSVVTIEMRRDDARPSTGSGVIIAQDLVLTNFHVVGARLRPTVIFSDDAEGLSKVLLHNQPHDLALLRVATDHRPILPVHPILDIMVGESVIAIGSPFGHKKTVTTGIVSALGRTIEMPSGAELTDLIQHDAAINPGNSGGPLMNSDGELIGLTVAIRDGAQGIAFSINVNQIAALGADYSPQLAMISSLNDNSTIV